MLSQSPLHDAAAGTGATFATYGDWTMPARFGDVLQEYQAAREGAVLIDVSHRAKVTLRGADRVAFLQNFCTNDVAKLKEGDSCEAFLTNAQAKIVAYIRIYAFQESLWLDAEPGLGPQIIQHLDRYLITEQVELSEPADFVQLHLTGPMANCSVPPTGKGVGVWRVGTHGYQIVCPSDEVGPLCDSFMNQGVRPAGLEAYEILRVEAGRPEYGKDIDDTNLPQEVGRDAEAISFTKGCYLGQETVARILSYGHVNRLLVGLTVASTDRVSPGSKVWHGNQEAGKVTSSVASPRLATTIALAYVRRGHHEAGANLEVEVNNTRVAARVTSLPFVE